MKSTKDGMDRRSFLRLFGMAATTVVAGGLLQACGSGSSSSAPAKDAAPAKPADSKPAEAAKPAESKPAAPAAPAQATTAPAAKTDAKPAASGDITVPAGNVTLTFWNGLTGPDGKILEALVGEFQQKYPNIKIEQQQIPWTDLYAKMLTAIPAGEGPDMALMHTYEIPRFADGKHITEITPDEISAQKLDASDFYDVAWKGGDHKSKRWSLPQDVPTMGMYLNNALFKKAGLMDGDTPRAPKTMEEFIATTKALTKGDEYGLAWAQGNVRWQWQMMLWQNGGDLFNDKEEPTLDTPEAIEVMQFHQDIFKKHAISPGGITNIVDSYRTGKFGIMIQGGWNIPALVDAKIEYTMAPMPTWFKKNVVWASSHQFVLPTPKSVDENKRKAALAYYTWFSQNALKWSVQAGHVAARKSVVKSPEFQALKTGQVVLANQEAAWKLQPSTHKIIELETRLSPALESVFLDQATPEQAMKTLQEEIKRVRV
jgi:multiple sugar transport system substrate-binding protein